MIYQQIITQVLQMYSYLMHSSCPWPAKDNTCSSIKTKPLELCVAVLPVWAHLADTNLVADHFNGLFAADRMSEKQLKMWNPVLEKKCFPKSVNPFSFAVCQHEIT